MALKTLDEFLETIPQGDKRDRMVEVLGMTVFATTRNPAKVESLANNGVDHVPIDDGDVAGQVRAIVPDGVDTALELVDTPRFPTPSEPLVSAVSSASPACFPTNSPSHRVHPLRSTPYLLRRRSSRSPAAHIAGLPR
ncbi:hypothetical protein QP572_09145 [Brevibacterium sp. UMB10442]|nr:hypothetical protein [Brevibacterium sp. UMB10442]